MRIVNPELLDAFRWKMACEWCGARGTGFDPHHIYSRGWCRLDVRINLLSLCRACHSAHHAGNRPLRCDLLAVVAAREGLLQDDIITELWRLYRAPKSIEAAQPPVPAHRFVQGKNGVLPRTHPRRLPGLASDQD